MAGEVLPPLFIYDSTATKEENYAVNDNWVQDFPYIRGKWGHKEYQEIKPFVAVTSSGSMTNKLFMDGIKTLTFACYPRETVPLEIKFNANTGELLTAPVIWNCDTGPGRLPVNDGEEQQWEKWAQEMMEKGVILHGLLPNSTSVSAVMDELYRSFKISTRMETVRVFAGKIYDLAKKIQKYKLDIKTRIENGEAVSEKEKEKVKHPVVATLNPADLGKIIFGTPVNGYPNPDSPFAKAFTKEKILDAFDKLGYYPFTRKMLLNKKVRHEQGQKEVTTQIEMMNNLDAEYKQLREKCRERGFKVDAFDAVLPTTTPLVRESTEHERAKKLAKTGKTASAGGIFRHLGSMVYNSEELLLARMYQQQ